MRIINEYKKSNVGKKVSNNFYGTGKVTKETDNGLYVTFDDGKQRIFSWDAINKGYLTGAIDVPKTSDKQVVSNNAPSADLTRDPNNPYYISEEDRDLAETPLPEKTYGFLEIQLPSVSRYCKIPVKYLRLVCREGNIKDADTLVRVIDKYGI